MVYFICNSCGDSLKKSVVEKHFNNKCRNNSKNVSCMDCAKDFYGEDYVGHTKCISEAEKYSGKDFKPSEQGSKNERKHKAWIEIIRSIFDITDKEISPETREILLKLQKFENIPMKQGKFQNFLAISLKVVGNQATIVWEILEKELEKMRQSQQEKNPTNTGNGNQANGVKRKMSESDSLNDKDVQASPNKQSKKEISETVQKTNVETKKGKKKTKKEKKNNKNEEEIQAPTENIMQKMSKLNNVNSIKSTKRTIQECTSVSNGTDLQKTSAKKFKKSKKTEVNEIKSTSEKGAENNPILNNVKIQNKSGTKNAIQDCTSESNGFGGNNLQKSSLKKGKKAKKAEEQNQKNKSINSAKTSNENGIKRTIQESTMTNPGGDMEEPLKKKQKKTKLLKKENESGATEKTTGFFQWSSVFNEILAENNNALKMEKFKKKIQEKYAKHLSVETLNKSQQKKFNKGLKKHLTNSTTVKVDGENVKSC